MNRRALFILCFAVLSILTTLPSRAQERTDAPQPAFEVASIKPGDSNGRFGISVGRGRFTAINGTVRGFVRWAYDVNDDQISGGPSWLDSDRYTIEAKPDASVQAGTDWGAQARQMLQTLLADRFKLSLHRESKELPVYRLTVAKGGLKPQKESCITYDPKNPPPWTEPGQKPPDYCGNLRFGTTGLNRTADGKGITTTELVSRILPDITGRTVIDNTGFTGAFDLHLEWTPDGAAVGSRGSSGPDASPNAALSTDSAGPSIFTAVQEQLGLKLEAGKAPVEVLVIDHVEKPSEN